MIAGLDMSDWHIWNNFWFIILVKFMYSEKATQFCEIFPLLLSFVVPVRSKVKISQNFLAFSEYMNFTYTFSKF